MKQICLSNKFNTRIALCMLCIFTLGFMLIGCADTKTEDEFKVAMLLPASKTDAGWNALAYEGLLAIEEELGAKIMDVESRTSTEQEQHFRYYAEKGFDLVFGHGYEFQNPAKAVAPDFPDTIFMTSSGGTITTNIAPVNFRVEQPAYLLGIIAGMMTQGNKLGTIGGDEIPSVKSTFIAFEAGAKSVNPDVDVRSVYVGNWEDIVKGKELATALINEGVDFLFPNADAAGLGAFEAAENAQAEGKTVYTFGANRDKSEISPTTVLANAVITPKAFVKVAKEVKDAKFKPDTEFKSQLFTFNMLTDQAITLTYNDKLKDKIPQEVLDAVEAAKAKILSGELEVPQIDFTQAKE
ncbi:BMP family protein [Candidatus Poribacteria bacterium]|nr:BMP family protein [Candidatus Poribacteria bacterium]